jgi:hypothetical protein
VVLPPSNEPGSAVFGGNAGHEDDAVAAFDSATTSTKNNTVSLAVFIIAMLSKPCARGRQRGSKGLAIIRTNAAVANQHRLDCCNAHAIPVGGH